MSTTAELERMITTLADRLALVTQRLAALDADSLQHEKDIINLSRQVLQLPPEQRRKE